jgi:transcriptional regulator of met regulon
MPRSSSKPRSLAALWVGMYISYKRTCEHSVQNVLRSVISIHLVVIIIITEAESRRDKSLMLTHLV